MKVPKEQKLEYYWETDVNNDSLIKTCDKFIKEGWVIHQIIPHNNRGSCYLLLYKY